jgi:dTDP-4-dehydrorhamnose 3,5-epimerase
MNILTTKIPGLLIIEPKVHGDSRGFFVETWHADRYAEAGIDPPQQDNLSASRYGVLRGLHLQNPHPQGKLVQVITGCVFDVAVDLRLGSPTYGEWEALELDEVNRRQFWIPAGLAHGFCVTSEHAIFSYKCSDRYYPQGELVVAWNDADLAITWPVSAPILSARDQQGIPFREIPAERLVRFEP